MWVSMLCFLVDLVLRFALLSSHYRSPLNFSAELLEQAESSLDSLYYALLGRGETVHADPDFRLPEDHPVLTALLDDLNTSEAISALHAVAARLNKAALEEKPTLKAELQAAAQLLTRPFAIRRRRRLSSLR